MKMTRKKMIKIVCVQNDDCYVYRVVIGDKIICSKAFEKNYIQDPQMIKYMFSSYLLKNVDIEEITTLEDKQLQEKSKLAEAAEDF